MCFIICFGVNFIQQICNIEIFGCYLFQVFGFCGKFYHYSVINIKHFWVIVELLAGFGYQRKVAKCFLEIVINECTFKIFVCIFLLYSEILRQLVYIGKFGSFVCSQELMNSRDISQLQGRCHYKIIIQIQLINSTLQQLLVIYLQFFCQSRIKSEYYRINFFQYLTAHHIINMITTIQSPQYSNSGKIQLFTKQRSPSLRNKRIPSSQEHLCFSNQNIKNPKLDSPSKIPQQVIRRKSQYMQNNNLSNDKNKRKMKESNNVQDIMNALSYLKEEYQTLKEAYKELIQQKVKSVEETNRIKQENSKLKNETQVCKKENQKLNQIIQQYKNKIDSLNNKLQKESKIRKKIENDAYFIGQKQENVKQNESLNKELKINTERQFYHSSGVKQSYESIIPKNIGNQSNLLSFSLSSAIEDSIQHVKISPMKRKDHIKVLSNLSQLNGEFDHIEVRGKKQIVNFKKNKKQGIKIDIIDSKQTKAVSIINPPIHLLNLKSPTSNDKKGFKNKSSISKRKKQEDKQNVEFKAAKKKSKKILQIQE